MLIRNQPCDRTLPAESLLKNKKLNQWPLFWLISTVVTTIVVAGWWITDTATPQGVSAMIRISVRCAVPLLYVTFAASALAFLFRADWSRWLLRNRKYLGLSFAGAMAWQLFFIIWLVTLHRDYYVQEVYVLRDVIEGVSGYTFLVLMTITSFDFGRRRLTARQWRILHKVGIYVLWIYAYSVYWWEVHYYAGPDAIDYLFYWAGFLAWGLRVTAWTLRQRRKYSTAGSGSMQDSRPGRGAVLVIAGLLAWLATPIWAVPAEAFLNGFSVTNWAELYLPYWPFEPFLPLFLVLLGAWSSSRSGPLKDQVLAR